MAIINLTSAPGNLTTFEDEKGVIFNFADPGTGAGTGQFATFLMIGSNSGTEEGFNTDGSPLPMDDMQQEHTNAVLLSTIPIVTIGTGPDAKTYYQIKLDVNEPNNEHQGDPIIQLDKLQLFQGSSGSPLTLADAGTKVYDSPDVLTLDDHIHGSATYDYTILIPTSKFPPGGGDYLTLYAKFTTAEGGFEEFGLGQVTPTPSNPDFTVDKSVDKTSVDGEDTLTYTVTVANTGDTALNVDISDQGYDVGVPSGDSDNDGLLDTDETWTYSFTRDVNQEDIDQGADLVNTVSVTTEGGTKTDDATTSVIQDPSMAVVKTVIEDSVDAANQTIHYGISVTNDGNVTLDAPSLSDANATIDAGYTGDDDSDGLLDVGETWVYSATHTVTQDEIDHGGKILNTASASSDTIYTDVDTGDTSNQVCTDIIQNPSLDVVKELNPNATGGTYGHTDTGNAPTILVGDKSGHSANTSLSWQYTVTNTGNVTLKDVFATDDVLGSVLSGDVLAPGGSDVVWATEAAANVAGLHTNTVDADGTMLYAPTHATDSDTGAYVGAQGGVDLTKLVSSDNGLTWSHSVSAFAGLGLDYKVTAADNSDTGLTLSGISVTDSLSGALGTATGTYEYSLTAGASGGTNTATIDATVSDDFGHSMSLSDSDSASYTSLVAKAGLSKGYWANHAWDSHTSSTITLGDANESYSKAGEKYAITFDSAGAKQMDNSNTNGDARIILGGQLVAAQNNTYMNHVTATGLVDAGAKWFFTFGGQDDNTANDTSTTDAHTTACGTVGVAEWAMDKKNGFTFTEGAAQSTSGAAWKGDLFCFKYTSQLDGEEHKVGVTGEGLKNALAAFDHGINGSDGLIVSSDGNFIAYQAGSGVYAQYDNTAAFNGGAGFWSDLKGGAFLAVLNDAELLGKVGIVGIHDDHGNIS